MSDYKIGSICELGHETLRRVLNFLNDDEIDKFCPYLEHRTWPKGAVLMGDGEAGDYMGFLLAGKLAVKKETSFPGKYTLVAIHEPGSMLGEISAVERGLRTATVVAMEEAEVLVLTSDNMDKLLQTDPALGIQVLKRIIHILSLRQRKAYDRLSKLL